jgi:hypothetical protein
VNLKKEFGIRDEKMCITRATLSWEVVLEIRKRCANGETQAVVAKICNISQSHTSMIVNNKSRKAG